MVVELDKEGLQLRGGSIFLHVFLWHSIVLPQECPA